MDRTREAQEEALARCDSLVFGSPEDEMKRVVENTIKSFEEGSENRLCLQEGRMIREDRRFWGQRQREELAQGGELAEDQPGREWTLGPTCVQRLCDLGLEGKK